MKFQFRLCVPHLFPQTADPIDDLVVKVTIGPESLVPVGSSIVDYGEWRR